jgi:hypothetical protein
MIRHVLLLSFKAHVPEADILDAFKSFESMPTKIDGVVSVEWGQNNSPEHINRGFTHCVFMTFTDEQGRDNYLPHPEHEKLKARLDHLLENIIVLDYQL